MFKCNCIKNILLLDSVCFIYLKCFIYIFYIKNVIKMEKKNLVMLIEVYWNIFK